MKAAAWWASAGLLSGIVAAPHALPNQTSPPVSVVVSGDFEGSLSPCGCTQPMSGGLKRLGTLAAGSILLVNGSWTSGTSLQERLKAQTVAQFLARYDGISAISAPDSRLGGPEWQQLQRLSGNRITGAAPLADELTRGPFLIGSASIRPGEVAKALGADEGGAEDAAARLAQAAEIAHRSPVLLFDGGAEAARTLATAVPSLKMIVYRSSGRPSRQLEKAGNTALVTPGDHGKVAIHLRFEGGEVKGYEVVDLGPEVAEDRAASELYRQYLHRVEEENLLGKVPRLTAPAFAGTAKCGSCHAEAYRVWKKSGHAHALATLERVGEGRDPECVVCHVTGLTLKTGFRSRAQTPQLAFVGCESCHGAGNAHALAPHRFKLPKLTANVCLSCHRPSNSPRFEFLTYWPKIRHQ